MKPSDSKIKVPQCQQRYIWYCGIYKLGPAIQLKVAVVYVDPDN